MDQKENVLVTGASGFIGKRLVSTLAEKGNFNVRCIVRAGGSDKTLRSIKEKFPESNIELIKGDLKNGSGLEEALRGIKTVYHLAAMKSGPIAASYYNTVVGTRNLLLKISEVCDLKRFVHVSSFSVYGTARMSAGDMVNEDTPLENNLEKRADGYTYVKLKQELLVWDFAEKAHIPVVVVRPGVVYGPGGDLFSRRIGFSLLNRFINIGRRNLLPLTYVDNAVEAIILAGTVDGADGEAFNLVDDELPTCSDYLNLYKKKVKKIHTINCPYLVFFFLSWIYDKYYVFSKGQIPAVFNPYQTASAWKGNTFENKKLKKRLGWSQKIPTTTGLEKTFCYFRKMESRAIQTREVH
jgi:nucleoside-diphosphate-sugar epimerase